MCTAMCEIDGSWGPEGRELSSGLFSDLDRWGGGWGVRSRREGMYVCVCMHVADSLHCTAETNTAL